MIEQTKIAITLSDDSLVIMSFINNDYNGIIREATSANINAEIAKAGFNAKSWRIIQDADLIPDRTFRNAWKDTGKIEVDMPKAREIHKDNLRKARTKLLTDLDIEYLIADEANDSTKKNEIKAKKQILRDITDNPDIVNATTPEQLKEVWFK